MIPSSLPDGFVRVRHPDVEADAVLHRDALPSFPGWEVVDDAPAAPALGVDLASTDGGTVAEVLAEVGDNPTLASAALAAEQSRPSPRSTLVDALTRIIDETES